MRKRLVWSSEKNAELQRVRGFGFCKLGDQARERGTTREELLAEILHDYVEGKLVKTK